jgi:hypothetical protein
MKSVEKDSYGNYLTSSRLSSLFHIKGQDGSITWQLNGKRNQFKFINFHTPKFNSTFGMNSTFAFQHDARIHSQNSASFVISILDNGSDGNLTPQDISSGINFAVDTEAMTCTLLHQYIFLTGVSQQQLKEAHNFSIIPIFSSAAMAGESNSSSPNSRGMGHVP